MNAAVEAVKTMLTWAWMAVVVLVVLLVVAGFVEAALTNRPPGDRGCRPGTEVTAADCGHDGSW